MTESSGRRSGDVPPQEDPVTVEEESEAVDGESEEAEVVSDVVDGEPEAVSDEVQDDEGTPDAEVEVTSPEPFSDISPTAAQRAPAGRDLAQDAAPVAGAPTPSAPRKD